MCTLQSSIDWDGRLPSLEWSENIASESHVEVPQLHLDPLNDVQDYLQYNPLAENQSFGLDIYLNVVTSLQPTENNNSLFNNERNIKSYIHISIQVDQIIILFIYDILIY